MLMEIPELNTALVEAYGDLDRTTRAAKQMAICSKMAQKQAQRATELWQVSEQRITVLKQQLQDRQPLGLPQPNDAPHSSFAFCRSCDAYRRSGVVGVGGEA